jgi:hypothetical protein
VTDVVNLGKGSQAVEAALLEQDDGDEHKARNSFIINLQYAVLNSDGGGLR